MPEFEEYEEEEKRIILYYMAVYLGYIVLVGGLIVFILLVTNFSILLIGGILTAYMSFALSILMTFLHKPIQKFSLRKYFAGISGLFLISSIALFLQYFGFMG